MPCKNLSSGICRLEDPDQPVRSDQGLPLLLTESLATVEYMNGEQGPVISFRMGSILHILCMFTGTFLLDATQIK